MKRYILTPGGLSRSGIMCACLSCPVMSPGAGDSDLGGLEGLAQAVEGLSAKFGKFVQEENAIVGQRHFARFHFEAASGERGHAGRMVRGAKGAIAGERTFAESAFWPAPLAVFV
jgi:hypothetical protein